MDQTQHRDRVAHQFSWIIIRKVDVCQSKQLLLSDLYLNLSLPIISRMMDVCQLSLLSRTVAVCQSKLFPSTVDACQSNFFIWTVDVCQSSFMLLVLLVVGQFNNRDSQQNSGSMPVQVTSVHGTECWLPPSGFPPPSYLKGVFPESVCLYLNTII